MRRFLIAFCLLSCANDPVSTGPSTNPEVPVSLLLEHDGCKVYRFNDAARFHYFVRCPEGVGSTSTTQSCGKNCTYTESIRTETLPEGGAPR